ncbi:hypothetical protein HGT71_14585 [Rosenbergiella epipactidis]|uniref:A24 family peptidase n=1 Tax=Rosenbergiella epipactidis TaxID=1544694 RepID=UPI001BD94B52|nr:prepilin peptidase [Rosenbergiella epipactidis]MBT0719471.1 hypothetical protein [Rosenbergiella epipactidis]
MLTFLLVISLIWVCYTDIRYRIIKNHSVVFIAVVLTMASFIDGKLPHWVSACLIFFIGAIAVYANFIGAGDIKLLSALALSFPLADVPEFIFFITLSGLPLAVVVYLLHRYGKKKFSRSVPYGVAIVSGYFVMLFL